MKNIIKTPEMVQENSQNYIAELELKNAKLEALVKYYEEALRLARQKRFGASSEKSQVQDQLSLFDEAENTAGNDVPEPTVEQITYTRRKSQGKRDEDLSGLPVETVEYELPENERACPECGEGLHTMTREVRRELKIIPAQVSVVEHIRHIYACRSCEKNSDHTPIVKADAPEPFIKGSVASPSAVAHIMVQKYVNSMPLYRQEQDLMQNDIVLSRQTMANWIIKAADDWLLPIYNKMREILLKQEVLHADETVLQVLKEPGKKANTNSYMWLYRTSGCAENPIVLYEYQPTRSSRHPKRFLSGFNGYLHTDGYAGYHSLPPDIIVVGCWAHARRKFDEALKGLTENERKKSASVVGFEYCNKLFALEREFESLEPEERYKKRLEHSKPIFEAFLAWAKNSGALPQSLFGKAVHYFLSQKPYLENIYLDGRLELSNNRAENSIRPFVIGRKNWLFCNTQKGAKASSVVYSIIETAKANGLKPFEYLKWLFEQLPNSNEAVQNFLPWFESLPQCCRSKR